jgi:CubicO group peptidase (beta-lactamase class C family)
MCAMHSLSRTLASLVCLAFLALASLTARPLTLSPQGPAARTAAPDAATFLAKVDEYMQAQVRVNRFSGTILLARQGKPVVSRGYGWANAEWQIPASPQTKYRLGSITKQFTSMAVMQLAERGKIKTEESICVYLSPCPDSWKPVTVHHLLTHTSGIPSYTNSPDYVKKMMIPSTVDEMVGRFRDLPLEFEPGSRFKYNNSGYFLLGVIIERTAGQPYEDVLRGQIFEPLGMKDTGYDHSDVVLPRRAAGYAKNGNALVNAAALDMLQPYSAGALYSTAEDLLKWDQALYTTTLLPEAAKTVMFTPFKDGYAYGWSVRGPAPATFGRRMVEHGGGINGFSTMITRVPDEQVTSIVLANVQQAPAGRVARDLLAMYFGEAYELPVIRVVAAVDPKVYDTYVGEYQITPTFALKVTRDGDRLMTQATGQPPVEVFPESTTRFFLKVVDAQITFVTGEDGRVTHLILRQNGVEQKGLRIK